jgi:hypothetical protein
MIVESRVTTAEVAEQLGCTQAEALPLLKAANVSHTRSGYKGPYLWSVSDVARLVAALSKSAPVNNPHEALTTSIH